MSQISHDWDETISGRKHQREQVTYRFLIFFVSVVILAISGMVFYSVTRPAGQMGPQPCDLGANMTLQPGETISCPTGGGSGAATISGTPTH